jgi:hypothetical protein
MPLRRESSIYFTPAVSLGRRMSVVKDLNADFLFFALCADREEEQL